MARRVIGLDVGTNAVRVAEVELGDTAVLNAFGQVALPPEAMREGEVVEPEAVTAAVARLFKEVGLRKGDVRVGLAGPRVIVRPVELPAMSDADLSSSLRFEAQELIPIPIDEAVLDFQVLEPAAPAVKLSAPADATEEHPVAEDQPMNRVLIAAAHRESVDRLVGAVRGAGLRPTAVDLAPLALIRSLGRRMGTYDDGAEAIVSVGGGVTIVVVHEAGLPRFVRMLGTGGRTLTEAVAEELDVSLETAEALKRQGDRAAPDLAPRLRAALERPLDNLVEDIRGSIDYYRTQPDAAPIESVVVTGGGAQQAGLLEGLTRVLSMPVTPARPRDNFGVGDIGFGADELPALDPYLGVPVGLAIGGIGAGKRINLLEAGGGRGGAMDVRKAAVVAGAVGVVVVAGLGFLTVQKSNQVHDKQQAVAAQEAANARVQSQIAQLSSAQTTQQQVQALEGQIKGVLADDVSWSRMLSEITRTMPDDVWLTNFSAQEGAATAGGSTGAAKAAPSSGPSGTVTFAATGYDYPSVAAWLQKMGMMQSFSNLWVSSAKETTLSGQQTQAGGTSTVQFSSTADLTPAALSSRLADFTKESQQ